MIRTARYIKFIKSTVACTAVYYLNDLRFLIPNLYINRTTAFCCTAKSSMHTNNLKTDEDLYYVHNKRMLRHRQHIIKHITNDTLNAKMITQLIEQIAHQDFVSKSLSLLLLSCCGSTLHNEHFEVRQKLVDFLWDMLKAKECTLTIQHYHALLQTYIDNDYAIDRNEFLKNMTVEPQYQTYCLLLRVLPNSNDAEFIHTIRAMVDKDDLKSDEKIYDALAYAYAMNGHAEKVKEIIKLMQEKQIQPTSRTYMYLMYTFAKNGNIGALINGLATSEINNESTSHFMQLTKLLSLSKNGKYIPDILKFLQPLQKEEFEVSCLIDHFVHTGNILDAYKLVTHIPISDKMPHIQNAFVLRFLQGVIEFGDPEILFKLLNDLEMKLCISDTWKKAVLMATKLNNDLFSCALLNEMKARNISITSDCFWPLLLNASGSVQKDDIYSLIKYMTALNVNIDSETLKKYIFPVIDIHDPITTFEKLVSSGMSASYILEPFIHVLLEAGKLKEAVKVCSWLKKKVDCQGMLTYLIYYYRKEKDFNLCVDFLFNASYNGSGFAVTFLKKLLASPSFDNDIEDIIQFLIKLKRHKIVIPPIDEENVKQLILHHISDKNDNLRNKVMSLIEDLTGSTSDIYNFKEFVHPSYMNVQQLYSHYQELKAKKYYTRGILRKLFMKSCKDNNTELLNEVLKEITDKNFEWTVGMKLILFDYYVKNNMLEQSRSIFNEIQSESTIKIDNFKMIRFAKLLVEHNNISEAFNIIATYKFVNQKPKVKKSVYDLLDLLARRDTSSVTQEMVHLLAKQGYCKIQDMLKFIVLSHIYRGDIESATNIFMDYVKKYQVTPAKQQVLTGLMQTISTTQNQKLMLTIYQQIVNIHGKSQANINLAIACALSNKTKELEILFKENGIVESLLHEQFKYMEDNETITVIMRILEIVKDTSNIDLELLCNLGLTLCNKLNDYKNTLLLVEKMKEKSIKPRENFQETLNYLFNDKTKTSSTYLNNIN